MCPERSVTHVSGRSFVLRACLFAASAYRPSSILISATVVLPAKFAIGGWLGVVDVMPNGCERLQIGKNGVAVFFRHPAVTAPRHDLVELSRLDVPGAYGLRKRRLVVGGDAGGVRRDI